jgi:hypothetical protein
MLAKSLNLVKAVVPFMIFILIAGCMDRVGDSIRPTPTVISSLPSADRAEIQLLHPGDNSLYYYAEGVRTPLILSLKWLAVKFVSTDPAKQSYALQGSIAGPLEEARQIPVPALTLLPLREGMTIEKLMQQINTLRADRSNFLQVNPVFQAEDAEMIITDEFIATFSPEKEKEAIDNINSSHGVEIVEPILGQANTFVLRVTEKADLDSLSMANLYQESGVAIYAAPNFVRILQN